MRHRLLIALLALTVIGIACEPGEDAGVFDTTTTSAAETTVTAAETTTTTAAPTTTAAAETTTTTAATTTTASTTTTTQPAPAFEFRTDGLGIATFGDSPAAVIAAMTDQFGPPTGDTGWIEEFLCPGPMNRFVDFGVAQFDLRVIFTTGDLFAPAGTEHFYSYAYQGATPVPVFPPELTVGTTVAQLQALYPTVTFAENPFIVGAWDYRVDGAGPNELLYGRVTGTGAGDVVTSVTGGIGCGE